MDTQVVLGGFTFQNLEIPAQINFGGDQVLVTHQLVGGQRVVDAMGPSDETISWSGLFTGPDALNRALEVDSMRIDGNSVSFSLFNLVYEVLIEKFTANIERFYQVNYSIHLKVVNNSNFPAQILSLLGIGEAILTDFTTANGISNSLNIPSLSGAMGSLNTSILSVPSFQNAPASTIQSITGPLNNVQSVLTSQISTVQRRLFGN